MGVPLAPSNLAAAAVSSSQINLTFDDNSEAVAGVNEVQRITWSAPPESGTFTLTFDEETTAAIDWDADGAAVKAALEATAAFEVGDVDVTPIINGGGYEIEYTGGLAAMNVDPISVDASELRTHADTISVTVTQTGIANVTVTPSIETITSAVAPVDEVQELNMNGASTGTYDLHGNGNTETGVSFGYNAFANAVGNLWGPGNASPSDMGGGVYRLTLTGALAGTPVSEMTVSNDATNGSGITISTVTQGVTGVHQVDEITFDGTATAGSCLINGAPCAYNAQASSVFWVSGAQVSATTPASGSIVITWDNYETHDLVYVSADTLRIEGRPEIFTIELDEDPIEGNFYLKKDEIGDNSYPIEFDDDTMAVDTALASAFPSYPVTVTGGPLPGLITVTSDNNVAPSTWTAHENTALCKGVTASVTTLTQGAPQEWAELGFIIERSDNGEDWEELVDLGANMESWPDNDALSPLSTVFYRVNAYNGDGSSEWSNTASATTHAASGDIDSCFTFEFGFFG